MGRHASEEERPLPVPARLALMAAVAVVVLGVAALVAPPATLARLPWAADATCPARDRQPRGRARAQARGRGVAGVAGGRRPAGRRLPAHARPGPGGGRDRRGQRDPPAGPRAARVDPRLRGVGAEGDALDDAAVRALRLVPAGHRHQPHRRRPARLDAAEPHLGRRPAGQAAGRRPRHQRGRRRPLRALRPLADARQGGGRRCGDRERRPRRRPWRGAVGDGGSGGGPLRLGERAGRPGDGAGGGRGRTPTPPARRWPRCTRGRGRRCSPTR